MSDDVNKKLKQITDILGQEKLPDNVQNLLSILAGAMGNDEPSARTSENTSQREIHAEHNESHGTNDFAHRARRMMERLGSNTDPKINLLLAIKPFLGSSRQQKVGNCIKILNLSRLASLMDENEP